MITTDKIRYNIGEYLWNFWQNNNDIESIKNAEKILRSEIEDGLRRRFQDFCEYQLLCNKLGIENKLNLESEERKGSTTKLAKVCYVTRPGAIRKSF